MTNEMFQEANNRRKNVFVKLLFEGDDLSVQNKC